MTLHNHTHTSDLAEKVLYRSYEQNHVIFTCQKDTEECQHRPVSIPSDGRVWREPVVLVMALTVVEKHQLAFCANWTKPKTQRREELTANRQLPNYTPGAAANNVRGIVKAVQLSALTNIYRCVATKWSGQKNESRRLSQQHESIRLRGYCRSTRRRAVGLTRQEFHPGVSVPSASSCGRQRSPQAAACVSTTPELLFGCSRCYVEKCVPIRGSAQSKIRLWFCLLSRLS